MRIKSSMDFGRAIKMARTQRGWSQSDLAEHLGSSQRWISEVENGKTRAELGKVLRCMRMLDITMEAEIEEIDGMGIINHFAWQKAKNKLIEENPFLNTEVSPSSAKTTFENLILHLERGSHEEKNMAKDLKRMEAELGQGTHHSQKPSFFDVKNPLLNQSSLLNNDLEKEPLK